MIIPVWVLLGFAAWTLLSPLLDRLAMTVLVARICQSLIHLLLEQTNIVAAVRFVFYFTQVVSMIAMLGVIAVSAGS